MMLSRQATDGAEHGRGARHFPRTQVQSWKKPRRVVAKVEWHAVELYPRVGFIVTNLARPGERVVAFYNQRGTAEQWIKEGKGAIKWTRIVLNDLKIFEGLTVRHASQVDS
jgi:hypothetical protein